MPGRALALTQRGARFSQGHFVVHTVDVPAEEPLAAALPLIDGAVVLSGLSDGLGPSAERHLRELLAWRAVPLVAVRTLSTP